jgi:phosphoglycolate phosphatase-like HAD superfamily hydrolase
MKTLVLFDIDGTLLDAAGAGRTGFYQALQALFPGHDFPGISMAGRTDHGLWHELAVHAPSQETRPTFEVFLDTYASRLRERLTEIPPREIPGSSQLLLEIARHEDLVPCLVTGNFREGARHKLQALGWWDLFEKAGEWASYGHAVPTKQTLATELLTRWQEIHPGPVQAIFLGDTMADLECAHHAGIPCVIVNGNLPDQAFLDAGAVAIWKDYQDCASERVAALRHLARPPQG